MRRSIPLLTAIAMLALLVVPAASAAATTEPTPIAQFDGEGDSAGRSWLVHQVELTRTGPLTITVDWADPTATVFVFLRPPGTDSSVASDRSDDQPKVLVHDAEETGTWEVAVKVKTGATAYTVTVEQAADGAPPPVTPTSVPDSWWQTDGRVRDVLVLGDQVWITGHFDAIRPPGTDIGDPAEQPRGGLAVLDRVTGAPLPLDTPDLKGNGWTLTASPDGATVYVGGTFKEVDGLTRKRLAAVDAATGVLTDWDPSANSVVHVLHALEDGRVLAGGAFTYIGGERHGHLAALDPVTGDTDTTWLPIIEQRTGESCPPRCEPDVHALSIGLDGELYVGGHFGLVNGEDRTNGAAIDLTDPTVTLPWDPNVFTPSTTSRPSLITMIAVPPADSAFTDRVLVCGDFKRVNGELSSNIGAVDPVTGVAVLGFDAQSNGGTPACAMDATTMYVGGHFTRVGPGQEGSGGVERKHVAALDPVDGTVLAWDPGANSRLGLHTLELTTEAVYVAGDFTRTAGAHQQGIARYGLP